MPRRYDDDYDDDRYDDLRFERVGSRPTGTKSQSGLGLLSVGVGVLLVFFVPVLFVLAAIMDEANNGNPPPDNDPFMIALGLGILAGACAALVGVVLGIVACCQADRSMVCGLIGAILNALILFGMAMAVIVGLIIGA